MRGKNEHLPKTCNNIRSNSGYCWHFYFRPTFWLYGLLSSILRRRSAMTTVVLMLLAYVLGLVNGATIAWYRRVRTKEPIGEKVRKVLLKERTKPWK